MPAPTHPAFRNSATLSGPMPPTARNGICESVDRPKRIANPGDYYMIRESPAVSVLVECGFLSNSTDEKLLQDSEYQDKIVTGIVNGFKEYLGKG